MRLKSQGALGTIRRSKRSTCPFLRVPLLESSHPSNKQPKPTHNSSKPAFRFSVSFRLYWDCRCHGIAVFNIPQVALNSDMYMSHYLGFQLSPSTRTPIKIECTTPLGTYASLAPLNGSGPLGGVGPRGPILVGPFASESSEVHVKRASSALLQVLD